MQAQDILLKSIGKGSMHATRQRSLVDAVCSCLQGQQLTLTGLGRHLDRPISERSAVRCVDRLVGNQHLEADRLKVYQRLAQGVVVNCDEPVVLVDWTPLPPNALSILRACVVSHGRAVTLYEAAYPEKEEGKAQVHKGFLRRLKELLPPDCRPIIVTDAGFKRPWFKEVRALGWHYVGRLRGHCQVALAGENQTKPLTALFKEASAKARCLGKGYLTQQHRYATTLFTYRSPSRGRHATTSCGRRRRDNQSKRQSKSACEPWVLASSLGPEATKRVIRCYRYRMQIEESFRDSKATSGLGLGLKCARTLSEARMNVLLLIGTLAQWVAMVIGWIAEQQGQHRAYQANSTRHKRVLSLVFLGLRIIKRERRWRTSPGRLKAALENMTYGVS